MDDMDAPETTFVVEEVSTVIKEVRDFSLTGTCTHAQTPGFLRTAEQCTLDRRIRRLFSSVELFLLYPFPVLRILVVCPYSLSRQPSVSTHTSTRR